MLDKEARDSYVHDATETLHQITAYTDASITTAYTDVSIIIWGLICLHSGLKAK